VVDSPQAHAQASTRTQPQEKGPCPTGQCIIPPRLDRERHSLHLRACDEHSPEVSVIVCTRNRPNDVAISVPASLDSKFRDFEVIVVDQSSNEISAEFVRRSATRDSRIRLVCDRGKGSARAHHLAIAEAKGEIVVFTDDDCQLAAHWVGPMAEAPSGPSCAGW
jgi:cellulose synthase/poly-beta-1,6-N-acetylglucosamine synthase-like glycosyltransferase